MGQLKVVHSPELIGLYANANRHTQPKGTVPRLSNLYMTRRGAFHTVPGSKWVSSFDGTAPHDSSQLPILWLQWYAPSANSAPDLYLSSINAPSVTAHHFLLALQLITGGLALNNNSGPTTQQLATQLGTISDTPNATQFGDYLIVAFGNQLTPNIFPTVSLLSGAISATDNPIPVISTIPFPTSGTVLIDNEVISYTGTTIDQLTGVTRGASGTTAAAHAANTLVYLSAGTTPLVWAPIKNTFDPTLIYGHWPGTVETTAKTDSVAVNIGTIIVVADGAGIQWLFRAQNSGVTGFGPTYPGPQFFPENGLEGIDGAMTAGSAVLNNALGANKWLAFTANMVGQPITVTGAGGTAANPAPLTSTVQSFQSATQITLADAATVTVTDANFVIGVGHFGDVAKDFNQAPKNVVGGQLGTEVWKNIGLAAPPPTGAAFVFQHLNNLYLWGTAPTYLVDGISGPDALWQSDNGVPMSFNAANTTFAGKGDGTQAQGGAIYSLSEAGIAATPQLVLFKDANTYSFLNSFPVGEALVQVSGGLGCVAPDTIQFIGGYGVMRLCYAGVALFDGQLEHVTEYTDAIRGYLFGGLSDVKAVDFTNIDKSVSTQSVNPPFYMFFAPILS